MKVTQNYFQLKHQNKLKTQKIQKGRKNEEQRKTTKYKNIKNILKNHKKATIILSIIVMNTFTFIGTSGAVNAKKIEIKKKENVEN